MASCDALVPFRLCSRSQPQSSPWDLASETRASEPSPPPPWRVSRQASQSGECWSALILCVGISLLCPLHPCCCTLLHGSEASPPPPPVFACKGASSVWKPFLLYSSLPLVLVLSLFFCLCFIIFLLPYPGTWGVSCLLAGLRSSATFSGCSIGAVPRVDVFLLYLWVGR